MDKTFWHRLFESHQVCPSCPSPAEVTAFFDDLLGILFADFTPLSFTTREEFEAHVLKLRTELERILQSSGAYGKKTKES
ncbi:hypothetical protein KK060_24740, partial [Fulvivirgaceae bacterium PWU20]|nr:hypothetical protein [Chryseosolibacter indicus]